ncbi:hypothetical protein AX760_24560 [Pararhizobium antarcticum]|uniref:Uncharacterized protein n=1 Tax=Pararhizobium antarcticum TaxID=1798805 RepID=A0A657LLS3_9HYPH|nr:hypothetical protein AX760_24560 [Pararhizobium antarcticum]OJF90620.1 hypothetical protein AX761_23385 [Rhizobium sp. 58]
MVKLSGGGGGFFDGPGAALLAENALPSAVKIGKFSTFSAPGDAYAWMNPIIPRRARAKLSVDMFAPAVLSVKYARWRDCPRKYHPVEV